MTEMSLVIRSGSYGSLQNSTNSGQIRRNSKMVVGSREKERRFSSVFKIASRRKIWMMLLLVTSAAVALSFVFAISKDVDQPADPETDLEYFAHRLNSVNNGGVSANYLSAPPALVTQDKEYSPSVLSTQHANANNVTPPPAPYLYLIAIPSRHPCENFSLPPQPLDPKRSGPRPCDVCYVPVDLAIAYMPALPSVSPVLKNLDYVLDDTLLANESNGGSIFGGHTSLQQRDESFHVKESMTVHCGFVNGKKPGQGTGFDISEADLFEMEQCHGVVIASAIFGNYDIMQQPRNIGEASRRTACFYMFVDKETETSIKNSTTLDFSQKVGLWRVVVVQNLPYADARRNGKVPKLLLHRLFPNARFSLWIDGKLELVVDPYQILERFLWRNNATFAISRHYRRFDVLEEAEANKAAGKYDNVSIDYQIEFYKREGLTHFSPAKYPITSDVPEGCVIIREHTPITNLFTCLWFNDVDRFTSRDQLSFSTVRDKIMSQVNWTINMFLDCERRNFVVQAYHRDLWEQRHAFQNYNPQPTWAKKSAPDPVQPTWAKKSAPDPVHDVATTTSYPPPKKQSTKRARDRRPSSRKHRFRGATAAKDPTSL